MTTAAPLTTTPVSKSEAHKLSAAADAKNRLTSPWASLAAVVIAVLWTIPTFGLLISSFRPEMAIKRTGWWTFFSDPEVTLDNYRAVFDDGGINLADFFLNSLVITIPSVVIPLCLASLAAYAFAWMNFPGKNVLFIAIFALQIVPLQVTLVPLLQLYVKAGLNNTFWTLWLSHSTFALPLAIYLLHNFIKEVPASLIEAARIDGAGHVSIFFKVLLPLLVPALAAFGIFQFLWVWNDLLVSLTFAGSPEISPMTVQLSNLSGTRGTAWHLLSAGAFVSIIVPVTVFLLLQRYFVRGLLAGSVKG
ncbi:sugar ABC transporter permease [Actinoplanes lobatus]|uniref:Alpha-glucoside transport system permease protein n=1 Tax=Actinoplanes lobatus TaxID=113568 RepID=A0A7W7MI92_9ACTN|nr:carbohydrate ABC transporter permease [Actinoplanes lobatus]MBB4750765.1 alpha-glucoside transport system permease protein [Actinoplanes lobatus]GGN68696.1 sugar ABC transporter permease [Actinoplanes lobatus]GIE42208.1 sugar ABC transporter permease [Actinoplanes lobatus]